MAEYQFPLPMANMDDKSFWEGCRRHELLVKKCSKCGAIRFFPDLMCRQCHSFEYECIKASGKGQIWSFTTTHHAFRPGLKEHVPYTLIQVKLEEGPVLYSNIVDCKPENIECDMPVEVVFEDITEEVTLPKFRPTKS